MEVVREEALRSVGHNLGKGNLTLEPSSSSLRHLLLDLLSECVNVQKHESESGPIYLCGPNCSLWCLI